MHNLLRSRPCRQVSSDIPNERMPRFLPGKENRKLGLIEAGQGGRSKFVRKVVTAVPMGLAHGFGTARVMFLCRTAYVEDPHEKCQLQARCIPLKNTTSTDATGAKTNI
jgi:hypothetical protein